MVIEECRELTLIKAGPARSIEPTRNRYHHSVPDLSLSWSACLRPSHITGTVASTGTNITSKCRNLTPVHKGSQICKSRKKIMPFQTLTIPRSSSGGRFSISSREASSMRPSPVLLVPWLSCSESCTNSAGVNTVTEHSSLRPRLVDRWNWHLTAANRFAVVAYARTFRRIEGRVCERP